MNSIQIAYINALLADAVYVENIGRGEINGLYAVLCGT